MRPTQRRSGRTPAAPTRPPTCATASPRRPSRSVAEADLVDRLADLAVAGANLQRGQILTVSSAPGKEALARAVAGAAYRGGAKFVEVTSFDLHVKRARIQYAEEEYLDYVPPWLGQRILSVGELRCATVGLTGPVAPGLFNDPDPERVGRDPLPFLPEGIKVVNDRTTNWTAVPCPTPPWAALVYPDDDPDRALERLWADVAHVCRLEQPDPAAAWRDRADALTAAAERLN